MAKYKIHLDFVGGITDDNGNYTPDPPNVFIWQDDEGDVLEVLEEPILINPSPTDNEENDWEPGPFAKKLLALLNDEVANG